MYACNVIRVLNLVPCTYVQSSTAIGRQKRLGGGQVKCEVHDTQRMPCRPSYATAVELLSGKYTTAEVQKEHTILTRTLRRTPSSGTSCGIGEVVNSKPGASISLDERGTVHCRLVMPLQLWGYVWYRLAMIALVSFPCLLVLRPSLLALMCVTRR